MPDRFDFAPEPHRVAAFLVSLVEFGAGSLMVKLKIRERSGQFAQHAARSPVSLGRVRDSTTWLWKAFLTSSSASTVLLTTTSS